MVNPHRPYTKKCPYRYVRQMYQHTSYTKLGSYLAIWGCYKIKKDLHDRGLMIIGSDKVVSVEDIEEMIDDALKYMHLDVVDGVREGLVIRSDEPNRNITGTREDSTYYHLCYMGKSRKVKGVPVWDSDEDNFTIIIFVFIVSIALGLLTSFICLKCVQ